MAGSESDMAMLITVMEPYFIELNKTLKEMLKEMKEIRRAVNMVSAP